MTDAPFTETLKRYRIIGVEDAETGLGIHAIEEPHGDWVDANAALKEINRLRAELEVARLQIDFANFIHPPESA